MKLLILRYVNLLGLILNLPILSFIAINYSKFGHKKFIYQKKLKKKTLFVLFKSRGVNDIIETLKQKKINYKIFFLNRIFFKNIYKFFFKVNPSLLNIKSFNLKEIKKNTKYKNYI